MSEEEGLITEAMVKKATYLIHKLADQKNETFETIRSKCKKMFGYINLAKLSLEDGHEMISKLIELTGEEETQQTPRQPPTKPDEGEKTDLAPSADLSKTKELEIEIDKLADMLQICVSDSVEIVHDELGKENITEGTRAILIKSFAATLFIEASRRGLGR
jgi:hypothetical protein